MNIPIQSIYITPLYLLIIIIIYYYLFIRTNYSGDIIGLLECGNNKEITQREEQIINEYIPVLSSIFEIYKNYKESNDKTTKIEKSMEDISFLLLLFLYFIFLNFSLLEE